MPFEQSEAPKIIVEKRAEKTSMDTPEYRKLGEHGECVFLTNTGVAQGKGNEDGLAIVATKNVVTLFVSDGIGGPGNGDIATAMCCDAVIATAQSEDNDLDAISEAMEKNINTHPVLLPQQGCCYSLTRIENNLLTTRHNGDVRTIVIRDGSVIFATEDDGETAWERRAYMDTSISKRNNAYSTVTFTLEPGDIVLLCSDGVTDNVDVRIESTSRFTDQDQKDADAGNAILANMIIKHKEEKSLMAVGKEIQRYIEQRMKAFETKKLELWTKPTEKILATYQKDLTRKLAEKNPQPTGDELEKFRTRIYNKIITTITQQFLTAKPDNFTYILYRHGTSET